MPIQSWRRRSLAAGGWLRSGTMGSWVGGRWRRLNDEHAIGSQTNGQLATQIGFDALYGLGFESHAQYDSKIRAAISTTTWGLWQQPLSGWAIISHFRLKHAGTWKQK